MTTNPDLTTVEAGPVSRAQLLDVLDDVRHLDLLPPRWRGVLIRARALAQIA